MQETRVCQNCKKSFEIDAQDFEFYEKISDKNGEVKVPAPTWCPDCRKIRRFNVVNVQNLYSHDGLISPFSKDKGFNVVSYKKWYSEEVSGLDYGKDYDFSKIFFEQFHKLQKVAPRWDRVETNSTNCNWCLNISNSNNCYLCRGVVDIENCVNCNKIYDSRDSIDCEDSKKLELCYDVTDGEICYKTFYSYQIKNIQSSAFLFDCQNCSNCLCSTGLRHKKYYFLNKQLSKEEFESVWDKFFNDRKFKKQVIDNFQKLKDQTTRRSNLIINSINCTGDIIFNSKNAKECFVANKFENVKFGEFGEAVNDSMDVTRPIEQELNCEISTAYKVYNSKYCFNSVDLSNCEYCETSIQLKNCFACVGLKNKQYCILNKQYTKEEYFKMVEKIKKHMNEMPYVDKQGREYKYGEFFPPELSPFAYNETIAQEYFPLTKEEAKKQGYKWKDPEKRNYQTTIEAKDLPDNIADVDESILKEVIGCATKEEDREATGCTTAFKIIPQELEFYKKMNLPIPRYCPNCRHHQRLKNRNPLKLYKRTCDKEGCNTEFETTYAPDRPEIVYCEKCYQNEVA